MSNRPAETSPLIDYAVSVLPAVGQNESGDACLVKPTARGFLAAIVDGAGHGPNAAVRRALRLRLSERIRTKVLLRSSGVVTSGANIPGEPL